MSEPVLLSKWWRTESAQRAIERANQQRQEKLNRLRSQVAERRAQLERDVEQHQPTAD